MGICGCVFAETAGSCPAETVTAGGFVLTVSVGDLSVLFILSNVAFANIFYYNLSHASHYVDY